MYIVNKFYIVNYIAYNNKKSIYIYIIILHIYSTIIYILHNYIYIHIINIYIYMA